MKNIGISVSFLILGKHIIICCCVVPKYFQSTRMRRLQFRFRKRTDGRRRKVFSAHTEEHEVTNLIFSATSFCFAETFLYSGQ